MKISMCALMENDRIQDYMSCENDFGDFISACRIGEDCYDLTLDFADGPVYYLRSVHWEKTVDLMFRFSEGEDFSGIIDSWETDKDTFFVLLIKYIFILFVFLLISALLVIAVVSLFVLINHGMDKTGLF